MSIKKKCVVIIPGIPYPPIDGHKLKIYNLILILNKYFDLHIVSLSSRQPNQDEFIFIKDHSYKFKFFKINKFTSAFRLVLNFFAKGAFQVAYFKLSKVDRYLRENSFEDQYVFFNLIRTAGYLDAMREKLKIFDIVDLLSKSYKKSSTTTRSKLFRLIYKLESERLLHSEKKMISSCNLSIFVNRDESNEMSNFGNVSWIPNGVNESLFQYQKKCNLKTDYNIAFFGSMFYQPNIDAVLWFMQYVFGNLDLSITFYIVGARPSNEILSLAKISDRVVITGFLDDPYVLLNSCQAIVAPMQNGGGIQNKILETMALGKINVLTSFAANPIIGAENGKHFFVEDNPNRMANLINSICLNDGKYRSLGESARKLILSRYTWTSYEDKIMQEIDSL